MKAEGVQAPSSQRGCNSALRVLGEPGRGQGRPHDHGPGFSLLTRVYLFVTLWTIARQTPPSMGFQLFSNIK